MKNGAIFPQNADILVTYCISILEATFEQVPFSLKILFKSIFFQAGLNIFLASGISDVPVNYEKNFSGETMTVL